MIMPPNASTDALRNRLCGDTTTPPLHQTNWPSMELYGIYDFVHPGTEVIKFFGGNDITVQYKMIHPYHTGKHFEKMKAVGKVVDNEL